MAKIIAIDPGHAKSTPGKRAGSFYEYKSNRNIAKILYKLLLDCGFKPVYTVDLDDTRDASLYDRARSAIRQNADAFVSIHSNAHSDPRARGTETYIHTNTQASVPFAKDIQKRLVNELGRYDRGVKRANFGVLRHSYKEMLCCLTEGEYFSTPETRKWMLTRDYEVKYATGVAKGLCEFYDVPFKGADPLDKGFLQEGDVGDVVEELQSDLKAIGYNIAVDGSYGPNTEKAVKSFQKNHSLDTDGLFGPNTQKALEDALKRYASVASKESEEEKNMADTGFKDVKKDAYYADALKRLKKQGVIVGDGDGNFLPDETLKRKDFVVALDRALNK